MFIEVSLKSMKEVETTRKYIEVVYNVQCTDLRVDIDQIVFENDTCQFHKRDTFCSPHD